MRFAFPQIEAISLKVVSIGTEMMFVPGYNVTCTMVGGVKVMLQDSFAYK